MNKKVKSLLVAGLLVITQGTSIFAMTSTEFNGNDSNHETHQHEATEENGYKSFKLDTGETGTYYYNMDGQQVSDESQAVIKIVITDGKYASVTAVQKNQADGTGVYEPVKIQFIHVKGGDGFYCYALTEGENGATSLSSPINNGGNIPGISHITVVYTELPDKSDEVPDEPGTVPPTGDASIMPYVATGAVATGLLVGINLKCKKDQD